MRAGREPRPAIPWTDARLETMLVHPGGRRETLNLSRNDDEFRGTLQPAEAGEYAIETTAYRRRPAASALPRSEFLVFDRDVELSTPAADPDLMASLAGWTRQEGGRAVAPKNCPSCSANWPAGRPNMRCGRSGGSSPARRPMPG